MNSLTLDGLADVCALPDAGHIPSADYEICLEILNNSQFSESDLRSFFETPSGTIDLQSLQQRFTNREISQVILILEWHYLLVFGHTLYSKEDPAEIKRELKIDNWLELLSPKEGFLIDSVYKIFTEDGRAQSPAYREFLKVAKECFDENSSPTQTTWTLRLVFDRVPDDVMVSQIASLTQSSQRGWAFFASILVEFSESGEFLKMLKSDAETANTDQEVKSFVGSLVEYIEKGPPKFPKLPNIPFIGNAVNSCYIDSTLIPLFLLIKNRLQTFENQTPLQKTLFHLFDGLATRDEVQPELVQTLRLLMQTSFPYKFMNPNERAQEDAGEFLSPILDAVLNLKASDKKLVHAHSFIDLEPSSPRNSEEFDYDTPFQTRYLPQESSLLDIPFGEAPKEGLSLASLVSASRSQVIERQIQRRDGSQNYCYLKADYSEQYMVKSEALAPDFLCVRLLRFTQGEDKRFDLVWPDDTLQFASMLQDEPPVQYELLGACIHEGKSIHSGHYYSMFFHEVDGEEKRLVRSDDLKGHFLEDKENGREIMATNGYIFFYRLCSTKN